MFEDIIGTNKKDTCKEICMLCYSTDIEVSEEAGTIYAWPWKWIRYSIKCNTCSNTYYISSTAEDTSERE